jgi:5'/3'-nucleotidase SurE
LSHNAAAITRYNGEQTVTHPRLYSARPGLFLCALISILAAPAWSLNILVGNDDSCTTEGINILADTLEAAGHTVHVYSPAGEQSGVGSSISTDVFQEYDISNVGFAGPTGNENRYCIRIPRENPEEGNDELINASATPRDSMNVGLAVMGDNPPDLVISGINDGLNIGSRAIESGTVGAALAPLNRGIPGIAVSAQSTRRDDTEPGAGLTLEEVAVLVVSIIAELEANRVPGEPLLPPMTGLNVNIPTVTPRGIAHTTLGIMTSVQIGPTLQGDSVINGFNGFTTLADLVGEEAAEELENNPDATVEDFAAAGLDIEDETSMNAAGYITITTLDGDLTATLRKRELLQVKLRDLQ